MNDLVLSLALSALSQLGVLGGGGLMPVPGPGYGYGLPGVGLGPLGPVPLAPGPLGPVPGRPFPYRGAPYPRGLPYGYRGPYGTPPGGRIARPIPLPVVPPAGVAPPAGVPRSGLPDSEAEAFGLAPYR